MLPYPQLDPHSEDKAKNESKIPMSSNLNFVTRAARFLVAYTHYVHRNTKAIEAKRAASFELGIAVTRFWMLHFALSCLALFGICDAQDPDRLDPGSGEKRRGAGAVLLPAPSKSTLRIATFNVALNRKKAGELANDLAKGDDQARRIAAIVQCVAPDILLVNELDYDETTAQLFLDRYLRVSQPESRAPVLVQSDANLPDRDLRYVYTGPVNTGVDSGLDLNNNGRIHDPDDAWGYGAFPGQYGMAVYSRFPIVSEEVRTFQKFRWSAMPGALRPKLPSNAKKPESSVLDSDREETWFHSDAVWEELRLSSKSHWDIPIDIRGSRLHILASHPTPPVFDGAEDRNGCRNHDEIRLLRDYISDESTGAYLVDDAGTKGPIPSGSHFVIVGDLNSDPMDGDGRSEAIRSLIDHPNIAKYEVPASRGAVDAAEKSAGANAKHRGNPAHDTGDFNDKNPGNLRIDFVLPSANCKVIASGVFWPSASESATANELTTASDHHLVWVDIELQ